MQYFIDETTLGKMCGVYVTYVADFDKGQWHVVTLVNSFNATLCGTALNVEQVWLNR